MNVCLIYYLSQNIPFLLMQKNIFKKSNYQPIDYNFKSFDILIGGYYYDLNFSHIDTLRFFII